VSRTPDDHLHQLVSHDVLVREVNEVDAFNAGQHAFGLDQPLRLPVADRSASRRR